MPPTIRKRSHFDADAMEAAQTEPTLTVGSLVYRGRLLSAPEWFLWNERYAHVMESVREGRMGAADLLGFYRMYFANLFPWYRRKFWAPDPTVVLMAKTFAVIQETFTHFFRLQALANGVHPKDLETMSTPSSPSTSGTSSSESTQVIEAVAASEVG